MLDTSRVDATGACPLIRASKATSKLHDRRARLKRKQREEDLTLFYIYRDKYIAMHNSREKHIP